MGVVAGVSVVTVAVVASVGSGPTTSVGAFVVTPDFDVLSAADVPSVDLFVVAIPSPRVPPKPAWVVHLGGSASIRYQPTPVEPQVLLARLPEMRQ